MGDDFREFNQAFNGSFSQSLQAARQRQQFNVQQENVNLDRQQRTDLANQASKDRAAERDQRAQFQADRLDESKAQRSLTKRGQDIQNSQFGAGLASREQDRLARIEESKKNRDFQLAMADDNRKAQAQDFRRRNAARQAAAATDRQFQVSQADIQADRDFANHVFKLGTDLIANQQGLDAETRQEYTRSVNMVTAAMLQSDEQNRAGLVQFYLQQGMGAAAANRKADEVIPEISQRASQVSQAIAMGDPGNAFDALTSLSQLVDPNAGPRTKAAAGQLNTLIKDRQSSQPVAAPKGDAVQPPAQAEADAQKAKIDLKSTNRLESVKNPQFQFAVESLRSTGYTPSTEETNALFEIGRKVSKDKAPADIAEKWAKSKKLKGYVMKDEEGLIHSTHPEEIVYRRKPVSGQQLGPRSLTKNDELKISGDKLYKRGLESFDYDVSEILEYGILNEIVPEGTSREELANDVDSMSKILLLHESLVSSAEDIIGIKKFSGEAK